MMERQPRARTMCALALALAVGAWHPLQAGQRSPQASADDTRGAAVAPPAGYVIGPEDELGVVFWGDEKMSTNAVVRPDGKITLPLLDDVQAAGYTPEQLAEVIKQAASKYVTDPVTTVMVREIRSRKVFVLGEVGKPGPVPLLREMNVLQLLAEVGGLQEYADKGNIAIIRTANGKEQRFRFNYNDVVRGRNLQQNILLEPNDVVLVR